MGALVLAGIGCGEQGGNTGGGGAGGSTSHGGAGGSTSSSSTTSSGTTTSTGTTSSSSGGSQAPTFADVFEKVFKPANCTNGSCHYGAGFSLTSKENAIAALVGTAASGPGCPDIDRVTPGDPEHSLLYLKVSMATPPCGNRMPPSDTHLDASQIELIRAWIEAGAPE
ncbi:Hypothetical protein A7982_03626 [Minicystis rosea]|nr:Hypothetical protein A7982_03626 [Minicystis rosea]